MRRATATGDNPTGEVSSWLHDTVGAGDRLQITLPFGDLTLDTTAATPLVLISAGIGVTPMAGMLEHLAAEVSDRRTLVLHADRSVAAHPLRDAITELVDTLPDATLHTWYQADGDGLMDLAAVELPADADYYLCGGNGFLQSVRAQLIGLGIPGDRVHFELFAPNDWLLEPATA